MVAQIIKRQIDRIEYREKNIIRVLFSVFIFLLISYGFLVNNTILNAVNRQKLEKEISILDSTINSLEFNYLSVKNSITLDLALSKGFVQVKDEKYVSIAPVSGGLSLSINENQ